MPRLLSFGFCANLCRLEIERIQGNAFVQSTKVQAELLSALQDWRRKNFVHGDLSPRNILVDANGMPWCTDWLLELRSYEGTPKYASDEVFSGNHSFSSDHFALHRIFAEFQAQD
jgi:serine/threonine protein kinase